MYDVNSKCADDFINHEEILDTLAYADENKENIELIDALIEKAKKRNDGNFLVLRRKTGVYRNSVYRNNKITLDNL